MWHTQELPCGSAPSEMETLLKEAPGKRKKAIEALLSLVEGKGVQSAWYCPAGADLPSRVVKGYFARGGTATTRRHSSVCPAGYYCSGDGLAIPCEAGYFCEHGAAEPTPCMDRATFCGKRAMMPSRVLPGWMSVPETKGKQVVYAGLQLCEHGMFCPGDGTSANCGTGNFCRAILPNA